MGKALADTLTPEFKSQDLHGKRRELTCPDLHICTYIQTYNKLKKKVIQLKKEDSTIHKLTEIHLF